MKVTFFNTYIRKSAYKRISDILKSTFISEGKLVVEFESKLTKQFLWINTLAVNSGTLFGAHVENRNNFIRAMKERGIEVSVLYQGIDRNDIFGGKNFNLINQRKFDNTQIHIPIHDGLSFKTIDYIVKSIKKGW